MITAKNSFFVLLLSVSVLGLASFALADDKCYPELVSIPGREANSKIVLNSGEAVGVMASFGGPRNGRTADFRLCYQTAGTFYGLNYDCDEAGSTAEVIGRNVAIGADKKASINWMAKKNPTNSTNPQLIRVYVNSGTISRDSFAIQVVDAGQETECSFRSFISGALAGQADLKVVTNVKCEGEAVNFFICSQTASGLQDCNTPFGQATVK